MLRGLYNIRSQLGWSCRLLPSKASWVLLIRSMIRGMVTLEAVAVGVVEDFLSSNLTIQVGVRPHTMVMAACNGIPSNLVHTLLLSRCLIRATVRFSSLCNSNKTWRASKELVNMLTSRLLSASSLIKVSLSNTTNWTLSILKEYSPTHYNLLFRQELPLQRSLFICSWRARA